MTTVFFFAGESSGDLHGAALLKALKNLTPHLSLLGVGGPAMRAEGLKCLLPMESFQVMGFSDVLRALPKLWKQFYLVLNAILKQQPKVVVLIDYPGFNLRLAKKLRQKGFKGKIVQYICPTVWAHGQHRIHSLSHTADLLLTIFPFEAAYFAQTPLKVIYVGHPLVDNIYHYSYEEQWQSQLGIAPSASLVALFPGSRLGEIQRNLPRQLEAARLLKKKHPEICFALSYAHEALLSPLQAAIAKTKLSLDQDIYLVPKRFTYELMRDCHLALAKSGTVTLELALHQCPTVVLYELTKLNYLMAKYVLKLKLPHYCIVNILAHQEVFPELIGTCILPQSITKHLEILHQDPIKRLSIQQACKKIKHDLGHISSNQQAAQALWELVSC